MTPEEKANEISGQFKSIKWDSGRYQNTGEKGKYKTRQMTDKASKQAALVCVEYILNECSHTNITAGHNGLTDREFYLEVLTVLKKQALV